MNLKVFEDGAAALPRAFFDCVPDCGIILGSGWGDALTIDVPCETVAYAKIPGLGASTVVGHVGEIRMYERHGKRVVAFCGRRHWYEGVGWEPVIFPVEMLRRMGCKNLLVTNAAGGINPAFKTGDLMVITDHINTVGLNPLIGPVIDGWGARFPDMSHAYNVELRELLHMAARARGMQMTTGVYAFTSGPVYETPAEIRSYAHLGADAVGMSTVPEVILANAVGMRIAGLSCISNMAAGIASSCLNHNEVMEASVKCIPKMAAVIDAFIERI